MQLKLKEEITYSKRRLNVKEDEDDNYNIM